MSSNIMIIDLAKYTADRRLLSGRDNGRAVWIQLNQPQFDPSIKIVIKNDGEAFITNSYFLGMLSDIFRHYTDKKVLLDHIDFKELNDTNQKELLRGINRGFSEAINGMQ